MVESTAKSESTKPGRLKRLPRLSPVALGYLIGPVALVVILVLMHFGVVVRQPTWLWIAVFALVPATSLMVDHLVRQRRSIMTLNIRVAQNVAAVTLVIYLSGWGPVLVLSFAFVALENISRDGPRLWRITAFWSMLGIAAGQVAIGVGWAPSELSIANANAVAFMGAFVLFFVIRMAGAMMEQKEHAESLVSRSEDRFRSLIHNSSDVTVVVSEGIFTYVSPSVTSMLGFDPRELVGRPSAEVIHDEDRQRVGARIRSDSSAASEGVAVQFRMLAKDGTLRLVEAVVADQHDRPSVGGLVANIRDITERTKAARELQRSHESFRVLFEQHPHPMWVYDLETLRFLEVNRCAAERYGYTRDEFLSMTIADIRPEEDARRLMNYLRVERPSLNYAGTWRHRTKAGEIIDVEVTTHMLEFRGRRGGLVMAQDITERLRLERQLHDHALHDALTGLPNRALLLDRIERARTLAPQSGTEVMVLRLNLDNFELINDTYGHDVGDALIRRVGERLLESVPETDTVGRVGGHEFVILAARDVTEATPDAIAERVLDLVRSKPFSVDGHEFSLNPSAGIVTGHANEGAELIENAGTALNLAKAEGGNRYVVFAHEMQAAVDERIQLTIALRDALGTEQFENFYQPVLRLKDLSVVGVEALARWRHPTLGLVPPQRFISLAEETGMIREIGRSVIRQACEQASLWHGQNKKLSVAVNVSVFQLRSDEFISDVRDALECSGLNPGTLVLEVTESILINNPETALRRLRALKELGVRLAIDDFGTGYSSLSYLGRFPFDILKIDQSFVASMVGSPEALTMVRTMVELGRRLKLEVIAEGVEREDQLDLLRRLHCHYVQGFHYSRPIDAEAMTWMLTEWTESELALPDSPAARSRRGTLRTCADSTPDWGTEMLHSGALPGDSRQRQRRSQAPPRVGDDR
jgi:diguanylate cyclase (GGDEF)-like protein/PAS domain S-box-containing protein